MVRFCLLIFISLFFSVQQNAYGNSIDGDNGSFYTNEGSLFQMGYLSGIDRKIIYSLHDEFLRKIYEDPRLNKFHWNFNVYELVEDALEEDKHIQFKFNTLIDSNTTSNIISNIALDVLSNSGLKGNYSILLTQQERTGHYLRSFNKEEPYEKLSNSFSEIIIFFYPFGKGVPILFISYVMFVGLINIYSTKY